MKFSKPLLSVVAILGLTGCNESAVPESSVSLRRSSSSNTRFQFSDITEDAGIRFLHRHGGTGTHYYIETMGPGCAFLDYDQDGWQDIFLVQGGALPGFAAEGPLTHALYRNLGNGQFSEVTKEAGLAVEHYGVGCCAADYDEDGFSDLFVTGLHENRLFRNNGNGTFSLVAGQDAPAGESMCTSAGFLDFDHDGVLDLFVCRYMDYVLEENPRCRDHLGRAAYCSPNAYIETNSRLYRGLGDGTFADVSESVGLSRLKARAMGLASADYNHDGLLDIYVSSDMTPNLLLFGTESGTFHEEGALSGAAYGVNGIAHAGMGVDGGDFNNDGHMDLVVTNFENEPNTLYVNDGHGLFTESTTNLGLGAATMPYLGWGIRFVDLDLDGWQDLFVANGHVDDYADSAGKGIGYAQPCRIYANEIGKRMVDVSASAGDFFQQRQVARGAAFGDIDNDADVDVLLACNNQAAKLLRNDARATHERVQLQLIGCGCNRDALGARVRVSTSATDQTFYLHSAGSYLSDHDRRLAIGIGRSKEATVEIRWPCGAEQSLQVRPGNLVIISESGCCLTGEHDD